MTNNTFINQQSTIPNVQPQSALRSCLQCSYTGETPENKCPNCGKFPLRTVNNLKFLGAAKIVWNVFIIAFVGIALLAIWQLSLWKTSFYGSAIFHGDVRANLLLFWGMFLAFFGSSCEIINGYKLFANFKPHQTLKMVKPLLRLLYIATAIAFVIFIKVSS